ncbi:hypothetical protein Pla22_34300 [Rubripirellula amarantea]|uniref:Uncharacterized protein n=1 Tax=Rubripirellula amarantea TaxID=2527999 RepID=A0A5C5WJF2_9BACT|nr:hypothetical protein [Rubripirellula amarantea]TWT50687.1 hypothetical protein Pla22_34300 [Rubripirellula amarantea]
MRLICLFVGLLPIAMRHSVGQAPNSAEIREAKLFETIGEIIDRRDEMLKRFAVVLQGESTSIRPGSPPRVMPHFFCRVTDSTRQFDLYANFVVHPDGLEHGAETVRIDKVWKGRHAGSLFVRPYDVKPKGKGPSSWSEQYSMSDGFEPYDDFLLGANAMQLRDAPGAIEKVYLKQVSVKKTEESTGGRLLAHWDFVFSPTYTLHQTVQFDPAYEMMPVRSSVRVDGKPNDFQEMRIHWSKHGKHLLPHKIETASGDIDDNVTSTEGTFKCHWAMGDEVPDAIYESEDHLAALFDHFKLPHAALVNRDVIHPEYDAPLDLYKDTKETKIRD